MIYYFSGTGNSEWVAQEIAKGTKDEAVNIIDVLKGKKEIRPLQGDEKLGLVFPVHAWRAPEIVTDFAKTLKVEKDTFVYAVCTCGEEVGLTIKKLDSIIDLHSAYSIEMPNNYIFGFDVDPTSIAEAKIAKARTRLPEIIDNINNRMKIFDMHVGTLAGLKSNVTYKLFNKYGKSSKKFSVMDRCTSCGLCEEKCPTGCITLVNGKPVWGENCIACSACINYCPVQAIQFGTATINKGRYYFKG